MALSNTQYNTLIRSYEAKQLENRHIVMKRKDELYQKFPRLTEIDETISSVSVAQARRLVDGDNSALGRLREILSALTAEKKQILTVHGYPENYFEPLTAVRTAKTPDISAGKNAIVLNRPPLIWSIPSPICGRP